MQRNGKAGIYRSEHIMRRDGRSIVARVRCSFCDLNNEMFLDGSRV
jgi:hypothetical protein